MPDELILSACMDDAADPDEQARHLLETGIRHMDIRRIGGKNVLDFTHAEAQETRRACEALDVSIHCLLSDALLSVVDTPLDDDLQKLGRLLELAQIMNASAVRVYTFMPPNQEKPANHLFAGMRRMKQVMPLIEASNVMVYFENEKGTVGEIPSNIHSVLHAMQHPRLRLAWNPASFVRAGVAQQVQDFWLMLGRWTGCVMLQDAMLLDGGGCLPGHGDGQVRELLVALREAGYQGRLALQPIPSVVENDAPEHERLAVAVEMVRRLLAATGTRVKAG